MPPFLIGKIRKKKQKKKKREKMLTKFLACMLFAFLIFLLLQVSELKAHVQLLIECVAETPSLQTVKNMIENKSK